MKTKSAILTVLLLSGCFRIVDVGGTDGGAPPSSGVIDLLFVMDDSGSTDGEQTRMIDAFLPVLDAVDAENAEREIAGLAAISLRIAVTTTSISLQYQDSAGNLVASDSYSIADPNGCLTSLSLRDGAPYPAGNFVHAPGTPPVLESEATSIEALKADFAANAKVGTCGSGQEQGLGALRLALETNPDFLREGSRLIVVLLSDEEDCSDLDRDTILSLTTDVCVEQAALPQGGTLDSVAGYVEYLEALEREVHVVTMVSAVPGADGAWVPGICQDLECEALCQSPSPTSSPCYCGGQSPGSRYLDFAAAFPGSHVDDLCTGGTVRGMEALQALLLAGGA